MAWKTTLSKIFQAGVLLSVSAWAGCGEKPEDPDRSGVTPVFVRAFGANWEWRGFGPAPRAIAVDGQGAVYVTGSTYNATITVFDEEGKILRAFNGGGVGAAIAVSAQGLLYAGGSSSPIVNRYRVNGTYLGGFETSARLDGQFQTPGDVAVDVEGNVYVIDEENSRVQKFDPEGTFLLKWPVISARGLTVDALGRILITNYDYGAVSAYDSFGNVLGGWQSLGGAWAITAAADGRVFVGSISGRTIMRHSPDGSPEKSWSVDAGIADMAIGEDGQLYVLRFDTPSLLVYSLEGDLLYSKHVGTGWGITAIRGGGVAVTRIDDKVCTFDANAADGPCWGGTGNGPGELLDPRGIAQGEGGRFYVADPGNHRVQVFSGTGETLEQLGGPPLPDGFIESVSDIAVDSRGYVYVADAIGQRIHKFTAGGEFLLDWGEPGTGPGQFSQPRGITVDCEDRVFVLDTGSKRVLIFHDDGGFVTEWTTEGIDYAVPVSWAGFYGIVVGPDQLEYVVDSPGNRVVKFSDDGKVLAAWGGPGTAPGLFASPSDIAIDEFGAIYVVDSGNARVQKFAYSVASRGVSAP